MGVPLWAFRLRSCPQGRRATGYVRNAPTLAQQGARPKNKKLTLNCIFVFSYTHNLTK
ncbi:MAG: hypothetical protein NZ519_05925 [Bacteroidia bacterium]|nr:hypothetical protein [Bacteroidia bacterium]